MTQPAKLLRQIVSVVFFIILPQIAFAQCECNDCPITLPSNSSASSSIEISGATSNSLGQAGQQLCRICIDFSTDAIKELTFELTAPDGSSILLFEDSGFNINSNMEFDICFVSCAQAANPDVGHADVFDTDDNWASNSSFDGEYYPYVGCLEDLSGTVDGTWTLDMEDDTFLDDSQIDNWYLVFANDDGVGCANASACDLIICDANAGSIDVTNSPACPAETISLSVSGNNTDPAYGNLILIVDDAGIIVEVYMGNMADYIYGYCGDFTAYSYNYEIATVSVLPHAGDLIADIDCNVDCCDLAEVPFSYEDLTNPFFTYLPPHPAFDPVTGMIEPVYCIDDLPDPENAEFDDNCIGEGISEVMITDLSDFCDGGLLIWGWALMDSCDNSGTLLNQTFINIEPALEASFIDPPSDYTTDCNSIPTSAPMLLYTNNQSSNCLIEGGASPIIVDNTTTCGGEVLVTWSDTDICGRLVEHIQTITVEPPPDPFFAELPEDMDITCDDIPISIPTLLVTNGESGVCLIEDEIVATVEDNYNGCSGTIIYTWEYTSECGVELEHMQTLNIIPPPLASFVDPPINDILPCDELSILSTNLEYTNGDVGECKIEGSVEAIVIGTINACGGPISYLWEFTDDCGRTISYQQDITLLASTDPEFLDIPSDITLTCDDAYDPDPLLYDNGILGSCGISGEVFPSTSQVDNIITVSWEHTLCDDTELLATQIVTLLDDPTIMVMPSIVTICEGESFDLETLTIDFMGVPPGIVTYHNDVPPSSANQIDAIVVSPEEDTEYVVLVTFPDGCQAYDEIMIVVDIPVASAQNGFDTLCDPNASYNLFDALENVNQMDGDWEDLDETGIDISNPTSVDLSTLPIGDYRFAYTEISTNSCLPNIAIATISIGEQVVMTIDFIECSIDELTYTVQIEINQNASLTSSEGTVSTVSDSVYQVIDISIDSTVTIYGLGVNSICNDSLLIIPPDCSCPEVEAPTVLVNSICPHEAPATIVANPIAGLSFNWYDVPIGGTALATNVNEFTTVDIEPGLYTYYVESMDENGCTSSIRTQVWFTIFSPVAEDTIQLSSCINFESEESIFPLTDIYQLLESSVSAPLPWIVDIYDSISDASNQENELLQDIIINSPETKTIYARVTDDNSCFGLVPITLLSLEYPTVLLDITDEVCNGGSDGAVMINADQDSLMVALDDFGFSDNTIYDDLSAGSHTLSVIDTNMCINELSFEIEMGYAISLNNIDFNCFGNETTEDETDDFWTMTFDASSDSGSSDFTLLFDGDVIGIYNFNQEYTLDLAADNLVHTILFVDNITGCNHPISTPSLNPCSTPCLEFPDASIYLDNGPILDCQVLEIMATSAVEENVIYSWWFNGLEFDSAEGISTEGLLSLSVIDTITGCMADSMINIINLESEPNIVIVPPALLTCEDTNVVIDGSMSDSGDNFLYQWYSENGIIAGANTQFLEINSEGWYYLELLNSSNNCNALDSVFVNEDGNRPVLDLDNLLVGECGNDIGSATVGISNATDFAISWTTIDGDILGPDNLYSVDFEGEGTYLVTVINNENLCTSTDSLVFQVQPQPSLDNLMINEIFCDTIYDAVVQFAPEGGTEPFAFYIDELEVEFGEVSLTAGEYIALVIDANQCEAETMISINSSTALEIELESEIEFVEGIENLLNASVNTQSDNIANVLWSPSDNLSCTDCLTPILLSGVNAVYTITVVDVNGCEATASIEAIYEDSVLTPPLVDIVVPNIFSPNGDGVNDYFVITIPDGLALDYLEVYVFDRWGEQMYFGSQLQSADESSFWNGTFNGQDVNPGVYVYYIKSRLTDTEEEVEFIGDISLIR